MRFVISTQEFNYLISKVFGVIPTKATVPVLANFLIECMNDELIVTATDLTIAIRCFTEAKILEEGGTVAPGKKLMQLIRELSGINVEVQSNPQDLIEITANSSKFKLHGMRRQEFPSLPDMQEAVQYKVSRATFKDCLFRTAFAVSREDNRYVFTGVCMQVANGRATFVGTDGKRLARTFMPLDTPPDFKGNYIIPLKAVEEILKNLNEEGEAILELLHDRISVEIPGIQIITKLLSGDYPDVSRVIPEQPEIVVSLHREELSSLLRQVSLFTTETSVSARFSFTPGELTLSANTHDVGEGKVIMPVNYQGEKFEIAFNPIYFLDILRHCKGESVTLGLTDPYNPGVITDNEASPALSNDPNPLYVIMPMRLNEE